MRQCTTRQQGTDKTNTTKSATVTVGAVSAMFSVTTRVDVAPNTFSFTAKTDAALSTEFISGTITLSGFDAAVPISITNGSYSIDGGAFTSAAGTISPL